MKKQIWIAVLTTLSMTLTSLSAFSRQKVQADSSDIHTFERVTAGQNNGLIHYKYVDDEGNEVIPLSKKETSSRKRAANLPTSYDSRESGVITAIKNQGVTGSCWAFGALKSLEASCIINGLYSLETADLSENHLAWYSYTPLQDTTNPLYGDYLSFDTVSGSEIYNIGGSAFTAMFTLANGWGAVTEDKAPFTAVSQTEANAMAVAMSRQTESLRSQSDVHIREVNCYDESNNSQQWNEIKQAVMEYGALDVSLYYNVRNLYQNADVTSMYQKKAKPGDANHCVSIVGWDDSFNTFKTDPEGPGAWLIANSYGEDYGMNGYFWLSYYDTSLCEFYSFEAETANTYDTSFQYDGAGWKTGYFDNDDIALANVFTNDTETPKRIDAASFYTYADSQDYKIEIYRNLKDTGPLDGEPVSRCTTSGTAERSGYHTVSLSEPIAVAPGESFSVIVTFLAGSRSDRMAYALVEGDSSPEDGLYYHSEPGQSYVYFASEDKWYDNTSYKDKNGTIQNMNNVCVKAFSNTISEKDFAEQEKNYVPETPAPRVTPTPASTTNANLPSPASTIVSGTLPADTPASSSLPTSTPSADDSSSVTVKVSAQKLTIGKGEQVKLPVTTKPASAKKKLVYQSSKKKIVSVNSNGKITGRKTGTAKITVRTSSGSKKSISVQVKKAPSSIQITAPKKKIKKGKTVEIKTKLSKGSASYQLTFLSLNPRVASITANGKIKAKKKGIVTIQVSTYNKKKVYRKIRVIS